MSREKKPKIFNPKHTKEKRRYLRNNMTKSEIILWSKIKNRQMCNCKFRRQHGIGNYIVDFYCPALKLVIEVDGESHYTKEGREHDRRRTIFLKELGLYILRFTNEQIKQNLPGVLKKIEKRIKDLSS
ncbi:endonuclease domain-containing protein [Fodinibius halophilus]|uniref:Endonuclease domain-containing protein n=1 Tax=Fodinibius halophilus TaxID=1736908 RepID=A0A6M1THC7_9BACT|nr:endonuclease domain-containing protein [Fodinibius halophilus]NGP90134.1 endonuclease domain-containing protein [Fodinibius halophilus]